MDVEERSFTVEASSVGEVGGRFINRTPRRAALKAARGILDGLSKAARKSDIRVQLRETTRGSKDKLFAYRARSVDVNKVINRGGKDIEINQEIKLAKVPLFHGDGARRKSGKTTTKKTGGNDGYGYYGEEDEEDEEDQIEVINELTYYYDTENTSEKVVKILYFDGYSSEYHIETKKYNVDDDGADSLYFHEDRMIHGEDGSPGDEGTRVDDDEDVYEIDGFRYKLDADGKAWYTVSN